MQQRELGRSGIRLSTIGVGTWAWGDRLFWRYGDGYDEGTLRAAFDAALAAGVNWFDTAEIYGSGASEEILGGFLRASRKEREVFVATKFPPFPHRMTGGSVERACDRSLRRLGIDVIDLYQVHWRHPFVPSSVFVRAIERLVRAGKVRTIGVSNYTARGVTRAREALAREEIVSNQVEYSLLHRAPERNGVLAQCDRDGVTMIAYSPLAQGLLAGKYRPGEPVRDLRSVRRLFRSGPRRRAAAVVEALQEVGSAHGATPSQVALSWTTQDERVVAIPGAKTGPQARENAGVLDGPLTGAERFRIEEAARTFEDG